MVACRFSFVALLIHFIFVSFFFHFCYLFVILVSFRCFYFSLVCSLFAFLTNNNNHKIFLIFIQNKGKTLFFLANIHNFSFFFCSKWIEMNGLRKTTCIHWIISFNLISLISERNLFFFVFSIFFLNAQLFIFNCFNVVFFINNNAPLYFTLKLCCVCNFCLIRYSVHLSFWYQFLVQAHSPIQLCL